MGIITYILGLYKDDVKENGNYYLVITLNTESPPDSLGFNSFKVGSFHDKGSPNSDSKIVQSFSCLRLPMWYL